MSQNNDRDQAQQFDLNKPFTREEKHAALHMLRQLYNQTGDPRVFHEIFRLELELG